MNEYRIDLGSIWSIVRISWIIIISNSEVHLGVNSKMILIVI